MFCWGCSSAGRAPALHAGGHRFNPVHLHQLAVDFECSLTTEYGVLIYGQAIKSKWWMPWRQEAMKDVVSCDKLRGAAKQALIRGFPNGGTHPE